MSTRQMQASYTDGARSLTSRFGGSQLASIGVSANLVTLFGAALCLIASAAWACQVWWWPAFWIGVPVAILGAWFDVIDGAVAKAFGAGGTLFGAKLDSFTDRVVETGMYAALGWVLAYQHAGSWAVLGCIMALGGSFAVTYARAQAEQLKLDGKAGFGSRAERLVLLAVMVLVGHWWIGLQWAGYVVALLAWFTAGQRVLSMRRQLIERGTP